MGCSMKCREESSRGLSMFRFVVRGEFIRVVRGMVLDLGSIHMGYQRGIQWSVERRGYCNG